MLLFEKPEIHSLTWVKEFMKPKGLTGSDRIFGTFSLWLDSFNTMLANYNGKNIPVIRYGEEKYLYYVPFYLDETKDIVEEVIKDAQKENKPFSIECICEKEVAYLSELCKDKFNFAENRDTFDYVYKTSTLAKLEGRKFHGKRNHITKFKNTYKYTYNEFTKENISLCLKIVDEWTSRNESKVEKLGEREAIRKVVENVDDITFIGGYIEVNGEPIAFSISEVVNDTMVDTHFEKALTEYEGIYSVINQEFAKSIDGKYEYINREEDMGIEGLRKAKLSYYPDIIIKKYSATLKGSDEACSITDYQGSAI